jgi:uncharacterized RDD family membrane protein YckC
MQYAAPFRRFVAFVIDQFVIALGCLLIGLLGPLLFSPFPSIQMIGLWWFGSFFFFYWLYYVVCESSPWQATVGKKCLKLKVVDLEGNRLSFGRATARYFLKFFSYSAAYLGLLLIFFTEKKQTLHDKLARTLVTKV